MGSSSSKNNSSSAAPASAKKAFVQAPRVRNARPVLELSDGNPFGGVSLAPLVQQFGAAFPGLDFKRDTMPAYGGRMPMSMMMGLDEGADKVADAHVYIVSLEGAAPLRVKAKRKKKKQAAPAPAPAAAAKKVPLKIKQKQEKPQAPFAVRNVITQVTRKRGPVLILVQPAAGDGMDTDAGVEMLRSAAELRGSNGKTRITVLADGGATPEALRAEFAWVASELGRPDAVPAPKAAAATPAVMDAGVPPAPAAPAASPAVAGAA